jgi:hypothetical protein
MPKEDTPQIPLTVGNVRFAPGKVSDAPSVGRTLNLSQRGAVTDTQAERLAKRFHKLYETLAPQYGYETRKASAVEWEQVPENNRRLMIEVCKRILIEKAI